MKPGYRSGDTIVEVLLAFAIFALLAIGTTVAMNRGLAMGQQSLERSLVRQQVDAQAELLRYARDTNAVVWQEIIDQDNLVENLDLDTFQACPQAAQSGDNMFILSVNGSGSMGTVTRTALDANNYRPASYFSQAVLKTPVLGEVAARGIWIQAVGVDGGSEAYDMYIRTCWDSTGMALPMQVSTIVRLYAS